MQFKLQVPNTKSVQYYRTWYLTHPKHLQIVAERAKPFLYLITQKIEDRGLPLELALLPVVESAFDAFAYSHGSAAGLWQFVPATGKMYGLQQNFWYDGRRDVDAATDFSIDRCARDVECVLDALDMSEAIVVGHSWGASVALRAAARLPARVRSVVLIDGGLFGPRHLVGGELDPETVREALRPPPLGMLEPVLWQAISGGDLSPYWSEPIRAALAPTFRTDETGRVYTRLGMDRHMAVLDGLIDYDPTPDIEAIAVPAWVVSCEPRDGDDPLEDPMSAAWQRARREQLADLPRTFFVQRWAGALHDVPLQWPAMVAGLLETVVERIEPPREEIP